MPRVFLSILSTLLLALSVNAQKIIYSTPGKEDSRRMNFEIIGKVAGNFMVYKSSRGESTVAIYNNDMEVIDEVKQEYIPNERLINIDFFPYADFSYVIYQYQRKNVIYCDAVKIDGLGKPLTQVMTLDTTHLSFAANNKVYTVITSENKNKLMVFKINSKKKDNFIVTTLLLDKDLALQKRSRFGISMEESHDYLDEFQLDNDGDFVFSKFNRANSESISNTFLVWKPAQEDTLTYIPIPHKNIFLDELHIKVDNNNSRYFLTSFYYPKKRGNIEGLYFYVWDKQNRKVSMENSMAFSEELRTEARGNASTKFAFNDYFVKNIIIKRNGGFIINTESYYTTSRNNSWNRWNYLGGPFSSYDYYSVYSPYSYWNRDRYWGLQAVRRHADNIAVLSFDNTGKMEWSGVIHKEQFDDESDERISFMLANTGTQIHYFFNMDERRALLLNDYTLTPTGQLAHNPTLKNLDRGYEFLPKFGKQVSANQLIVPCYYRNYICFAKIEFN